MTPPDRRANSIMTAWALACLALIVVYGLFGAPPSTSDAGEACDLYGCDGGTP